MVEVSEPGKQEKKPQPTTMTDEIPADTMALTTTTDNPHTTLVAVMVSTTDPLLI